VSSAPGRDRESSLGAKLKARAGVQPAKLHPYTKQQGPEAIRAGCGGRSFLPLCALHGSLEPRQESPFERSYQGSPVSIGAAA
jgi:hypothetical protein